MYDNLHEPVVELEGAHYNSKKKTHHDDDHQYDNMSSVLYIKY